MKQIQHITCLTVVGHITRKSHMTCLKDELIYVDKQVFVAGVDTFLLKIRKPFVMTLRLLGYRLPDLTQVEGGK